MEDDLGGKKYGVAYELIKGYVEQNLDVYKVCLITIIYLFMLTISVRAQSTHMANVRLFVH